MRGTSIGVFTLLAVLAATSSCGLRSTAYKGDSSVQLYSATSPVCPTKEIGEITWGKSGRSDIARQSAQLRAIAREMGGDAVALRDSASPLYAGNLPLVISEYRAVVIKFRDKDCRK